MQELSKVEMKEVSGGASLAYDVGPGLQSATIISPMALAGTIAAQTNGILDAVTSIGGAGNTSTSLLSRLGLGL